MGSEQGYADVVKKFWIKEVLSQQSLKMGQKSDEIRNSSSGLSSLFLLSSFRHCDYYGKLFYSKPPFIALAMPPITITTTGTQTELCDASHNSVAIPCVAFVLGGIAAQLPITGRR